MIAEAADTGHTDAQRKTVVLAVPGGAAARYLVRSDISVTLRAAGVRLIVLVPPADGAAMLEDVSDEFFKIASLRTPPRKPHADETPWRRAAHFQVRRARRFSLDCRDNERSREKYEQYRAKMAPHSRRWADRAMHLFTTSGLWRSRTLRRMLLGIETRLTPHRLHSDLFDEYRPDLVVVPGLGYFEPEEALMREARDRGVKIAALIHAWDSPSTKGYRGADADLVVVWSERMREQVMRYQDIPGNRIKIGGVPQWDRYLRDGALPARAAVFEHFDLDPDRRLLVYATPPPNRTEAGGGYHAGIEVASWLARRVDDGTFGADVQLLVRLHPNYGKDGFAEQPQFEELAAQFPNTHVNRPAVASERVVDSLTNEDRLMLGGLIKHCDVLVNFWSTTLLESCLLDTPVVIAHFNPSGICDKRLSNWHQFAHLQALVQGNAARVAEDPVELVEYVRAYLADPTRDAPGRKALARTECGPLDGSAGRRVGAMLLEALGLEADAGMQREQPLMRAGRDGR